MRAPFDVIFCRNVVIYFDKDTQRSLFDRMADALTEGEFCSLAIRKHCSGSATVLWPLATQRIGKCVDRRGETGRPVRKIKIGPGEHYVTREKTEAIVTVLGRASPPAYVIRLQVLAA